MAGTLLGQISIGRAGATRNFLAVAAFPSSFSMLPTSGKRHLKSGIDACPSPMPSADSPDMETLRYRIVQRWFKVLYLWTSLFLPGVPKFFGFFGKACGRVSARLSEVA